jgi:tellurite resistance protein
MEEHQEAMVKSLVGVAWADGRIESDENEVIEALIDAFELGPEDAIAIKEYARTPRSIDDVPLTELSAHDRRMLLQHAVILTFIDGEQTDREREVLAQLVGKLNLPEDEAKTITEAAEVRAKRLIELL